MFSYNDIVEITKIIKGAPSDFQPGEQGWIVDSYPCQVDGILAWLVELCRNGQTVYVEEKYLVMIEKQDPPITFEYDNVVSGDLPVLKSA